MLQATQAAKDLPRGLILYRVGAVSCVSGGVNVDAKTELTLCR